MPMLTLVLLKFDYAKVYLEDSLKPRFLGLFPKRFWFSRCGQDPRNSIFDKFQTPMLLVHRPHFESHCSTLPHFWPFVLVPSHQTSSRPTNCPRASSFACSGPVTTSVFVILIDLEVQVVVLCHPWLGLFLNRTKEKGPNRPPVPPSLTVEGVSSLFARSKKDATLLHESSIGRTCICTGPPAFTGPSSGHPQWLKSVLSHEASPSGPPWGPPLWSPHHLSGAGTLGCGDHLGGQQQSAQNRVWAGGWRLGECVITAGRAFVLASFRLYCGALQDELPRHTWPS